MFKFILGNSFSFSKLFQLTLFYVSKLRKSLKDNVKLLSRQQTKSSIKRYMQSQTSQLLITIL